MSELSLHTAQARSLLFLRPPAKTKEPTAGTSFFFFSFLQESEKNPPDLPTRHRRGKKPDRCSPLRKVSLNSRGPEKPSCPRTLHASLGHHHGNHTIPAPSSPALSLQNDHMEINIHIATDFKLFAWLFHLHLNQGERARERGREGGQNTKRRFPCQKKKQQPQKTPQLKLPLILQQSNGDFPQCNCRGRSSLAYRYFSLPSLHFSPFLSCKAIGENS